MDARERRLAENEALFRDVNEGIEAQASAFGRDGHLYEFLCECSNRDCNARIVMALAGYEAVRSESNRFAVKPGHHLPDIETVVRRTDEYWLVEKEDAAADLVEELDPRKDE